MKGSYYLTLTETYISVEANFSVSFFILNVFMLLKSRMTLNYPTLLKGFLINTGNKYS